MEAPRASGPKAPAQRKVEQQVAALAEGPIRQALLQALSGALPATVVSAAAQAIQGFGVAQRQELSTLFSKAGVSAKASPRADANAERAFLLQAIAGGAVGATLQRLAQQIRGRPPSNQGFTFNPLSGAATPRPGGVNPADVAAAKLKASMDDIWGTDEDAVLETLEALDPALLPQVAEKYEKRTGTPLREALELELEGPDLKRALAALARTVPAAPAAPVQVPAKVQAPAKAAAPVKASSVSDIQKNLDAIQVRQTDKGPIRVANAVEFNALIPSNPKNKADFYNPLRSAVRARNKAQAAVDKAATETARKNALKKLEAADKQVTLASNNLKAWMRKNISSNPELQRAHAAVQQAEKDPAKTGLATARADEQKLRDALLARIDAYPPMVDVPRRLTSVTVDGRTLQMHDAVDTAYTNSWQAVDGGALTGDTKAGVAELLQKSGLNEDRQRIIATISEMEGSFSKVNTWDIGRVSWGFTQWTLGADGNGSLADFMRRLKKSDPAQYEKSFGRFGIDIDKQGVVLTRADGTVLKGVEAAEAIRTDVKLAAVFMAAGTEPVLQQEQIRFASEGKISAPRNHPVHVVGKDASGATAKAKLRLKDVVTSEYGTAILADLTVNAGNGPRVAAAALKNYVERHGVDPSKVREWAPDAEKAIIAALEDVSRDTRMEKYREAGFSKEPHSFSD